jgi:hypothetical protein
MSNVVKRVASGFLLAVAFVAQASAAVVTVSSAGTIINGNDYPNMFQAGLDLTGLHYSQSITIDTAGMDIRDIGAGVNMVGGLNQRGTVYGKTTVNNISYAWQIENQEAHVYLWNLFPTGYPLDQAGVSAQGTNVRDGQFTSGVQDIRTQTNPFLNSLDFGVTRHFLDLTGTESFAFFLTNTDVGQAVFSGQPDYLLWEVQSVPEPDTIGLIVLGLGLIGFTARRRRQGASAL